MHTALIQADTTDLVLIGGGHAHLTVIKQLTKKPITGLQITVISKDIKTPYSGMLPGLIAGHYSFDEAHIDLRKLCQSAGIRLLHSEVCSLDTEQQLIHCSNRPPVRYDYLSINSGSRPALESITGANRVGIAVKPIDEFLQFWKKTQQQLAETNDTFHLAVVGGGAASVEVALACQFLLKKELNNDVFSRIKISIVCKSQTLLNSHNAQVQHRFNNILSDRGIGIKLNHTVILAEQTENKTRLDFVEQQPIEIDEVIWAIHAGSPSWPQNSGLNCDENGFISVNQYLQSSSHDNVFAAGDIANFLPKALAKNGVYAVRAGQQLSNNLRCIITGQPLSPFNPQQYFLGLLMTGDKHAVASRGSFSIAGKWVWLWKDFIDRRFMKKFQ